MYENKLKGGEKTSKNNNPKNNIDSDGTKIILKTIWILKPYFTYHFLLHHGSNHSFYWKFVFVFIRKTWHHKYTGSSKLPLHTTSQPSLFFLLLCSCPEIFTYFKIPMNYFCDYQFLRKICTNLILLLWICDSWRPCM